MKTLRIAVLLMLVAAPNWAATSFIQEVHSLVTGATRAEGFQDVNKVFGPPQGSETGLMGSLDVLNLGIGGEIILRFRNPVIYNGPGPDFTVFENVFYDQTSGRPAGSTNLETGTVAVSSDGIFFLEFPTQYLVQDPPVNPDYNPDHYIGFAGLRPTFSHPNNGISPFDPTVSGGDSFDLEDLVGLPGAERLDFENIRYVRIRDTGINPTDSLGVPLPEPPQPGDQGFDLDALAVINGKQDTGRTSVPDEVWQVYP